jgi:hypothetical protein
LSFFKGQKKLRIAKDVNKSKAKSKKNVDH